MGNIIVTLDASNKVSTIQQQNLNFTDAQLNSYKNFLNTYGVIKVSINYDSLKQYIIDYINTNIDSLTFSINSNDKNRIITQINESIFFAIQFISKFGYAAFNKINSDSFIPTETTPNAENKNLFQTMPSNISNIDMIIPKVIFTSSKSEFINFLTNNFNINNPERQKTNEQDAGMFILIINKILDSLNQTTDIEIKITNIIGILIKSYIMYIVNNYTKPPDKKNAIPIYINIVIDILQTIPNDSCLFKQNKLNFIQIETNICNNPIVSTTPPSCPTLGVPLVCPTLGIQPVCPTLGAPPVCPTLGAPPSCLILSSNLIFVMAFLTILFFVFGYLIYKNIQKS